jgi:endonuclease/exonuclease/phosphatase family metal-dependent hydrolase
MRRIAILLAAIGAAVLISTTAGLAGSHPGNQPQAATIGQDRTLTVMTRNVYHGVDAEFAQVIGASPDQFLSKVAAVYNGYQQRNFPERADALAEEIEATHPDVVGLQEAIKVRTDRPPNGTTPPNAQKLSLDYLQILLDKLQARGLQYEPVVQRDNFDIEAPADENSDGRPDFELRHTDRIAMLVRTDPNNLTVLGTNSGHFQTNCTLPTRAAGGITILRGWTSVDLSVRGKAVRLINTHLDGDCMDPPVSNPNIQLAQAREILQGPVKEARDQGLPVILLGDLNSKADGSGTQTYAELLKPKVGFVDAWTEGGSGKGLTCCQDDFLLNTTDFQDRRDYVLFGRGPFQVINAQLVGADPITTPSGLRWPSDHAGVVARLNLPPE